jgi:Ni/Co efflux regulator RcnB
MHRSVQRGSVLSAIAACAVLAGPVAGAQASDSNVRSTIDAYNGRIAKDESRILNTAATYDKTHNATPLVNALHHEVRDLRALKAKLGRERGSTARGRRGRSDVVKGLGLIAGGYNALAKDVRTAGAHRQVTSSQLQSARADDKKGHNLVIKGLRLLGK